MIAGDDFQTSVLRMYTALTTIREDWGGLLIVCFGLGQDGAALAMAANIAGAVCLSVEESSDVLKSAMRLGACDFAVNTLDEALRAMKNEVRKHLPISVALEGSAFAVLQELVERGVQPEVLADFAPADQQQDSAWRVALEKLSHQGALPFTAPDESVPNDAWTLNTFSFDSAASLKDFDKRALDLLDSGDIVRRRWLRSASRILQRQRPLRRTLWLTADEKRWIEV